MAEIFLKALGEDNSRLEAFLKSKGVHSDAGTTIFDPPDKSFVPQDVSSFGVDTPSFRQNTDTFQEIIPSIVQKEGYFGFGLPLDLITAGSFASIVYVLMTAFSDLANSPPSESPGLPQGSQEGGSNDKEMVPSSGRDMFSSGNNQGGLSGGGHEKGRDDRENNDRGGNDKAGSSNKNSLNESELKRKLEEMIRGLLLSISEYQMGLICNSYDQLMDTMKTSFTLGLIQRALLTKNKNQLWDIVALGNPESEPRFFTRKSGTTSPFNLKTDPEEIRKLKKQLENTSGKVNQDYLLSDNSIESISSRRNSRVASARSARSCSIHIHNHQYPGNEPPNGSPSCGYQQHAQNLAAAELQRAMFLSRQQARENYDIPAIPKLALTQGEPNTETPAPLNPKNGTASVVDAPSNSKNPAVSVVDKERQKDKERLWTKICLGLLGVSVGLIGGGLYAGRLRTAKNTKHGHARGREDFIESLTKLNNSNFFPWDYCRPKLPLPAINPGSIVPHSNKVEESRDFRQGRLRSFESAHRSYTRKNTNSGRRVTELTSPVDESCLDAGGSNLNLNAETITKLVGFFTTLLAVLSGSKILVIKNKPPGE